MTIKELFEKAENGTLTYEQFEALRGDAKFVDLSEGKYVSKQKYDSDISAKSTEIQNLNNTIELRNTDLTTLKGQLDAAGTDTAKLAEITESMNALKQKYDADVQQYQAQLAQKAYESAVRDFANDIKFSSKAAKRDFVNAMIAKKLTLEGDKIIGGNDFLSAYTADNADALMTEKEPSTPAPAPTFVASTPGDGGAAKKPSLSEMMRMKNENPDATITF